jgi:hypothetical protein
VIIAMVRPSRIPAMIVVVWLPVRMVDIAGLRRFGGRRRSRWLRFRLRHRRLQGVVTDRAAHQAVQGLMKVAQLNKASRFASCWSSTEPENG